MDTIGASIGSGVIKQGDCFVIMGTAARVLGPLGEARFESRFMNCTHFLPDLWLYIRAINGVGSSLRWIRDMFCRMEQGVADFTGRDVYDLITAQAAQAPPGSKGLLFLPYISDERTPIENLYARVVFFGVVMNEHTVKRTFHTGFCVGDLDWTIGFFQQAPGFKLIDKAPRDPGNQSFVTGVPIAQVMIAYMDYAGHSVELQDYRGSAHRWEYRPRMVDQGPNKSNKIQFVVLPDGVHIEFMTRVDE